MKIPRDLSGAELVKHLALWAMPRLARPAATFAWPARLMASTTSPSPITTLWKLAPSPPYWPASLRIMASRETNCSGNCSA